MDRTASMANTDPPSGQSLIISDRCRARRWIIQERTCCLGQHRLPCSSRPQLHFVVTGEAGIEGAELLGCWQTHEFHPAVCGGVTIARDEPITPSFALPPPIIPCSEQVDLLKIVNAFCGSDHLVAVLRAQPVDWSLAFGVTIRRNEPFPGFVR